MPIIKIVHILYLIRRRGMLRYAISVTDIRNVIRAEIPGTKHGATVNSINLCARVIIESYYLIPSPYNTRSTTVDL